jgi:hypothetical protein
MNNLVAFTTNDLTRALVYREYPTDDFIVNIGRLDPKGHPVNGSYHWEQRPGDPVGCRARVWLYKSVDEGIKPYLGYCGPELGGLCDDPKEYMAGAKGLEGIHKRLAKIQELRGSTADAVDQLGRWVEACGLTHVYVRPPGEHRRSWHSEGTWDCLPLGIFLHRIRTTVLPKPLALAA